MGLTFDVDLDEKTFRRISGVSTAFQPYTHWWEIKFSESWGERSFWTAALKPDARGVEASAAARGKQFGLTHAMRFI